MVILKKGKKSIVIKNKNRARWKAYVKTRYDEEMDGSKSETNRNPLHQLKKNLIGVYGTTISCKLCRFRDAAIVKIQQRIYLRHNEPFVVREHNNKNNKKRKKKAICCVFLERSSQIG